MEFITIYWWRLIVVAVASYLLGSFRSAVIFSKMAKKKDVREMGSGNAGFTNVLRSVGIVPAILTFVFDFVKGLIAVYFAVFMFNLQFDAEAINALSEGIRNEYLIYGKYLAGAFCVLGHSFPVFFGFRGGKGITTMAGILLALDLRFLLLVLGTFLVFFILTRIISVGSLMAALTITGWNWVVMYFWYYKASLDTAAPYRSSLVLVTNLIMLTIAAFVIFMHRGNIKRLIKGEEKKIKAKK